MSKIEWTEKTWNPIVGCSVVSSGCTNCYAMRMAARLEAMGDSAVKAGKAVPGAHYAGTTKWVNGNPVWTGRVALAPDRILTEPLRRKKPTMWFVNSMGDLFHEDVPDEWIGRVFTVMAQSPQHTFQILTKRGDNMRRVLNDPAFAEDVRSTLEIIDNPDRPPFVWPLPNVWLGVSAERQQEADERVPDLLAAPAAVRFVSAEPLLGPVDFTRIFDEKRLGLDWIIVGGESGPRARPMHPDWVRSIRDQCVWAGVPFFFKQWGEYKDTDAHPQSIHVSMDMLPLRFDGDLASAPQYIGATAMMRVGKVRAGRLLDGREWNEMPSK